MEYQKAISNPSYQRERTGILLGGCREGGAARALEELSGWQHGYYSYTVSTFFIFLSCGASKSTWDGQHFAKCLILTYSSCIIATVPGWWVHEDSDTQLCWDRWQVSFSGWEGGVPDIILRSSVRTSPLYLGRCCKAEVNTPSMGRNCIPTRHMGAGVWDPLSLWEDSFSPLPLSFGSIFAFSLWRFHHALRWNLLIAHICKFSEKQSTLKTVKTKTGVAKTYLLTFHKYSYFSFCSSQALAN